MHFEPIAIVGQSCILPGALDPAELWDAVLAGQDLTSAAADDYWRLDKNAILTAPDGQSKDKSWSDRGGYVRGFDARFDPNGFTLPASEIETLDPLFHWVLHGVREALQSAQRTTPRLENETPVGLVLGNLAYPTFGLNKYAEAAWFENQAEIGGARLPSPAESVADPRNRFSSGLPAHLAVQALNLGGEAFSLDAACASSLYAIKLACDRLQDGRADLMVAGAVNRTDDLFIHIGFCALQAMSKRGQSRPFEADADGLVPAEGAAFVVLKRLADAVADSDKILGVIRGIGLSNDGSSGGFLSPAVDGQVRAMAAAYEMAGLMPSDISLLECHATGTPVGDSTEIRSATQIFDGQLFDGVADLPIGSLKSNMGHLITVAGAAGLLKVLGALRTETRPPSRPVEQPIAIIDETPFRILQAAEPWLTEQGADGNATPRRAAISAFGFGGNNAHLIVEEWVPTQELSGFENLTALQETAIAIVDLEVTAGGCQDASDFRRALLEGLSSTQVETVDIEMSGLRFPPNDLKQTLPQQLLILEVARRLANRHPNLPTNTTSVFVGMGCDPEIARYSARWRLPQWAEKWRAQGLTITPEWLDEAKAALIPGLEAAGVVGTMPNIPANRINAQLNLHGPSYTVSAEELSGIRALECAADALRQGVIDTALVGAVDLSEEAAHQQAVAQLLDATRQKSGDAAVVLLLKRVEDAERDGDAILAILDDPDSQRLAQEAPSSRGKGRSSLERIETKANSLHLGLTPEVPALTQRFGHAHAASGLLHVAAAAICLQERMLLAEDVQGQPQPSTPWLADSPRTATVRIDALGGQTATVRLQQGMVAPAIDHSPATSFHIYSGADANEMLRALEQGIESDAGPARLVIVTHDGTDFDAQVAQAKSLLSKRIAAGQTETPAPQPLGKSIYWSSAPMPGELSFVFTGAAAAYQGMGRELLLALPELGDDVIQKFPGLTRTQSWLSQANLADKHGPFEILQGCTLLSQVHAILTQEWLGLKPDAVLGVSSGETNSVFALNVWHDMETMFDEMDSQGMYTREIAGKYQAARRIWQKQGVDQIDWIGWRILAPVEEVEAALVGEAFAYLTMINSPTDCLVAGQADACRRVVEKIGRHRAVENRDEIIAHHPVMKSWERPWYEIHSRETQPVPGVRFYSNASGTHYAPTRETVAAALTDQATSGVDFRRVVNTAWDDGVRIFVEHGPRNVCSGWIRAILGERPHLVVALDRPEAGIEQTLEAVAQLIAAGVVVDHAALTGALNRVSTNANNTVNQEKAPKRTLSFPAHYPPVKFPPLAQNVDSALVASPIMAQSQEKTPQINMNNGSQMMEQAPPLPPVLGSYPQDAMHRAVASQQPSPNLSSTPIAASVPTPVPAPVSLPPIAEQATESAATPQLTDAIPATVSPERTQSERAQMVEQLTHFHGQVSAAHQMFLAQQERAMNLLLRLPQEQSASDAAVVGRDTQAAQSAPVGFAPTSPVAPPAQAAPAKPALVQTVPSLPAATQPAAVAMPPAPALPPSVSFVSPPQPAAKPIIKPVGKPAPVPLGQSNEPPVSRPARAIANAKDLPGPKLDREQLEHVASGKISEVLGAIFAQQDDYERQVRMPMPPLLLADRVLGIDAEAGAYGQKGVIWTETDVREDSWYLYNGHMPAGIMIESGQADLLLISYLGADFANKSERVYRLLGCEATFHGALPAVGETLHFQIHVDGYAQQGDVRLFFFHYDCYVADGQGGERLALSVRHGQAGFFTDEELDNSAGILWDPQDAEVKADVRLDQPAVPASRAAFSAEQVTAYSESRITDCFGDNFWLTKTHVRTPTIASGRMLLFDEVADFDPVGGPWGRGYLRAEDHLAVDEWFFAGHFKNDNCMPGTLMLEGSLQTMAFYLTALGYTLDRDGWRFEPVPEQTYTLRARGQVTPGAQKVTYELFVEEVIDGPIPMLYADLLCTVDGLRAFHCQRMGLRLVPAYPLESRNLLMTGRELHDPEPAHNARTPDHVYDPRSIAACAWGKPSDAFGEIFARFDGPELCPRLPGPPYLFMSRITNLDAEKADPVRGGTLEAEYQIPPAAWYFAENGSRTMPYAVLLEAALQPCGWFASYKGVVLQSDMSLYFRNLDGTATQLCEVFPEDGILHTHVTNSSLSRLGSMTIVAFDVVCTVRERRVFEMTTSFGFFPKEALAGQAGLPVTDDDRARLVEPSDFRRELGPRPPRYCNNQPALPGPMLLLLDRVSGFWSEGGSHGLGRIRAEIDVDPQTWFFKCHFMGDSVQPGSLGIEAMIQTLQFYMLETDMADNIERPRFEPIQLGQATTWKYRGQVMPSATRVTVEVEITERGSTTGEDGAVSAAFAVGDVSYWADGLRIYEATGLGMRLVSDQAAAHIGGDEVLDPAVDLWLRDHCPTWTVPALAMMSMVDRLAAGAIVRAPGRKVTGLRNILVHRWLGFDDGPQQLKVLGTPMSNGLCAMQLQLWEEEQQRYATVASGDVLVSETWPLAGAAWTPLLNAQEMPDPYAAGELFHGPAYQMLTELQMNDLGATYWLDLDVGDVPVGALNQGLLDAATHGIPHDALGRWAAEIPADVAAYPVAITQAQFFGATPTTGQVRCEARFGGFRAGNQQFPIVHIQILSQGSSGQDKVWAEIELVEALFPKGPIGSVDPAARRAFLQERVYTPAVRLSHEDGDKTILADTQVKESDWLAGTIAAAYGVDPKNHPNGNSATHLQWLTRQVAIREHIAHQIEVHPAHLLVNEQESANIVTVAAAARPLNRHTLAVERMDDGWQVTDTPVENEIDAGKQGALSVAPVRDFWRNQLQTTPSLVEDLTLALMQRFVGSVVVENPAALAAVQGKGVLYLANHQLDLESVLFVSLMAGIQGTLTAAMARQELNESWVGPYYEQSIQHPNVPDLGMLLLIDRASPEEVLASLKGALDRICAEQMSLLIHVEGVHALRAGQPVEVVSASLIDLAVERSIPIVPVRFAGGLPVDPVDAPLAFPVDYGQQEIWVGEPILPATLQSKPSAARKEMVLAAINGFGGRWESEEPTAGDAEFAEAVRSWQGTHDVSETEAALYRTLEAYANPSKETAWLLAALGQTSSGPALEIDDKTRQWIRGFSQEILGVQIGGALV